MKKPPLFLLFFWCFSPLVWGRDNSMSVNDAIEAITKQTSTLATGKPIRLAVVPFAPTQKEYQEECAFGSYLTEGLIASLSARKDRIKLFERSRLDAVSKELALNMSGFISDTQAKKIGELAPIDYILTGTFTKLASSIEINGRVVDVVSGEIKNPFRMKLKLTDDLKSLFAVKKTVPPPPTVIIAAGKTGEDTTPACPPAVARVDSLMDDLTSPASIDRVVSEAITIPFERPCGEIHFDLLSRLTKYHIINAKYRTFLLHTLAAIENPDKDYFSGGARSLDIERYLTLNGEIDDEVWNLMMKLAERSDQMQHLHLGHMFLFNLPQRSMEKQYRRIDEYFSRAKAGKIGRPVALPYDRCFSFLFHAVSDHSDTPDNRILYYCVDKYAEGITDKTRFSLHEELSRNFLQRPRNKPADWADKKKILQEICKNLNAIAASEELGNELLDFGRRLQDTDRVNGETGEDVKNRTGQAQLFITLCKIKLGEALALITPRSGKREAVLFCLRNGIDAPSLVPTLAKLQEQLFSSDIYVRMETADYLAAMGRAASPAEAAVIKALRRSSDDRQSGVTNFQWSCIEALGNIKTQNSEAIGALSGLLSSPDNQVPDYAMVALASIGTAAIPSLKKLYNSTTETYVQIYIVKTFGLMKKGATGEIAWLREQQTSAKNPSALQNACEDAIAAIGK